MLFWRCNTLLCFCWVFSFVVSYLGIFMFPRCLCNSPYGCYASTVITIINLIALLIVTLFTACGTPGQARAHVATHFIHHTAKSPYTKQRCVFRCAGGRPSRSMFVCLIHLTGPHGPIHFVGGRAGGRGTSDPKYWATFRRWGFALCNMKAWETVLREVQ